jgi:hypothetical protein
LVPPDTGVRLDVHDRQAFDSTVGHEVVDGNGESVAGQSLADGVAEALGCAGHEGNGAAGQQIIARAVGERASPP